MREKLERLQQEIIEQAQFGLLPGPAATAMCCRITEILHFNGQVPAVLGGSWEEPGPRLAEFDAIIASVRSLKVQERSLRPDPTFARATSHFIPPHDPYADIERELLQLRFRIISCARAVSSYLDQAQVKISGSALENVENALMLVDRDLLGKKG